MTLLKLKRRLNKFLRAIGLKEPAKKRSRAAASPSSDSGV